jgi:hypothetical protein
MEQQIIETCIRRRQPLPEKIANAPKLFKGLEPYYIAFWELSTDRPSGFGAGQIPWSSIDRYATREELDYEGYMDLVDFVRAMDRTFLKYHKEQSDARDAKAKAERNAPIAQGRRRAR